MKKIVVVKDRKLVYKFEGYSDMAKYVDAKHDRNGSSVTSTAEWTGGTKTVAQATGMMVSGTDGVLEQIGSIRDKVRERIGSIDTSVFRFENNVYGTRLDMGSYLADSPTCFLNAYEEPDRRPVKFVRILVDTTFSAMVPARDIVARGSAVVALCDTLNLCGYTTEVWAVSTNGGSGRVRGSKELAVLIPVQRVGEPWDVRSAMFPLSNAGFLRRLVFGVMESMSKDEREAFGVGGGYGTVMECKKGSLADSHCGGADIICTTSEGSIRDIVSDPVAWVLKQCHNLGVIDPSEVA